MIIEGDFGKIFFTSDHHFGHANIIKYCDRPFESVEEMDKSMIERWNEVVPDDGTVFHLGDFTLLGVVKADEYFEQLKGNIKILAYPWHHDYRWLDSIVGGETGGYVRLDTNPRIELCPPMAVLEVPALGHILDGRFYNHSITLCHYPMAVWDRKHYGAWHLHGHSHGSYKYQRDELAVDVGVDDWDFAPISMKGIVGRFA